VDEPTPTGDDWPDRPLTPEEARDRLDAAGDARAVWVMDHGESVRSTVVPDDGPEDAVVDLVVETDAGFEMYSYTRGQWIDYGMQRHDDDDAPSMAGTLESYRVLTGDSDVST